MADLTIERDYGADPERVWSALTGSRELAEWFWPPRLATEVDADTRVGGGYRIASEVGGMAVAGVYRAVDPPEHLSCTWRWDGEDEETVVTVDLRPTPEGTHLRLVNAGFSDTQTRDEHADGWQDCLERLPAHLRRGGAREEGRGRGIRHPSRGSHRRSGARVVPWMPRNTAGRGAPAPVCSPRADLSLLSPYLCVSIRFAPITDHDSSRAI